MIMAFTEITHHDTTCYHTRPILIFTISRISLAGYVKSIINDYDDDDDESLRKKINWRVREVVFHGFTFLS
jgi:hypothetical protein